MSNQITTQMVSRFKSTLQHLVQQKGSVLRGYVRQELLGDAEDCYFDQIGATEAQEKTARHGDSPLIHTPHSRRKVEKRDFEWGDMVDALDLDKVLTDPSSAYLQSAMWLLGRKMDDVIIEAALGSAKTGKNGNTSVVLPAGQKIAVGASGLTLAKLLQTKEILDANEVDPDEPRYIAVTARQVTNLLNTTEVKNADYNSIKALVQGQINSFLGFNFVRIQRLTKDVLGDRQVIAWAKEGLLLAVGQDIKGQIAQRPDKSFATYAYASLSCGATRMEEKKVVEIACME